MYHSISFGSCLVDPNGKMVSTNNTWDDWHLIPTSKPIVAQPGVSTKYVDIPGRADGQIDLTEYLTGGVLYGQRSGSFEFYIVPDYEYWETIRRNITAFLHGKKMRMVLEDDPGFYYEGRFSLTNMASEAITDKITISYVVGPYKHRLQTQFSTWLWNPFNFDFDRTDTHASDPGWL